MFYVQIVFIQFWFQFSGIFWCLFFSKFQIYRFWIDPNVPVPLSLIHCTPFHSIQLILEYFGVCFLLNFRSTVFELIRMFQFRCHWSIAHHSTPSSWSWDNIISLSLCMSLNITVTLLLSLYKKKLPIYSFSYCPNWCDFSSEAVFKIFILTQMLWNVDWPTCLLEWKSEIADWSVFSLQ